ncbi:phage virion morphogenesis protein [Erwinia sp. PsM31]|uniref:phage virion morphogenesis protein n=1 Tax=Erwinia sp. PsM31 TaxID=3030535 RepID=UPI00263A3F23|nr:phage virion morphogenesis protein [Erwinia sp. PsM31]MDN4629113.1 phage virion morphogenesis protein [Erwinia sp. PsM31]
MNGLEAFDARLNALIGNLSPAARKEMARTIAKRLRAGQQQNIKRQQAPDGTAFKPRKAPVRKKKGRIKREMFARLRTAKYMKAKGTADDAVVEFAGNVQRMARVHHYGLRDRPARGGKEIQYEARPLLGLSDGDLKLIEDEITNHLSK